MTPGAGDAVGRKADRVLSLDAANLSDDYRAPVDVMLAQWLGLFCSLRLGLKPDCPSPNRCDQPRRIARKDLRLS